MNIRALNGAIIIYFPHHASFLSYSVLFNAEILMLFYHHLRLPKNIFNWGVGAILAHHGDNYKNEIVVGHVQEHTVWPKYPMNNSRLKVKHKNIMPACEIHSVNNGE